MTRVKLTDCRCVGQSTIMPTKTLVHIIVKGNKPAQVTPEALVNMLDNYFDIPLPSFATPRFPVRNIDLDCAPFLLMNSLASRRKHDQIDALECIPAVTEKATETSAKRKLTGL